MAIHHGQLIAVTRRLNKIGKPQLFKKTNFCGAYTRTLPFSQLQFCKSDMLMANFMIDQKNERTKKVTADS